MKSPLIHFLVALAIGGLLVAGYVMEYVAISKKSSEAVALQEQILSTGENMKRIASARAALAEIAGDEANVRSYFVSESSVVAFIDDLESRGQNQKASVSVLSVSKSGTPARPTLVFALSITGTFDAIMRTIGAIEYAPYDILLTRVSVSKGEKEGWHAEVSLSVGSVPMKTATSTPQS
ncbi:MAG: hypothetical protein WAV50_03530 [Minisyncoccia bacterium]